MAPCNQAPSFHRTLGLHAPQPESDHVSYRKRTSLCSLYRNTPSPSHPPHHLTRDGLQTVACRAVRRLATFQSRGAEMYSCVHPHSTSHLVINIYFRHQGRAHKAPRLPRAPGASSTSPLRPPFRSAPSRGACMYMYGVQPSVLLPVVTRFSLLTNRWRSSRTTTCRRQPSTMVNWIRRYRLSNTVPTSTHTSIVNVNGRSLSVHSLEGYGASALGSFLSLSHLTSWFVTAPGSASKV